MSNEMNQLQHMTWREVEVVFEGDPVVIIPLGSMEVQGPHSITGDYLVAEEVAKEACRISGAYCVPVVPFGYSEYFRGFPGTISVQPMTLYNWVKDICVSLAEHGISKILFLNGHAGNDSILEFVGRDMRREYNIVMGRLNIWRTMTSEMKKEIYGDKGTGIGHGGGIVDAVVRHLYPEEVKEELAGEPDAKYTWGAFSTTGIGKADILGSEGTLYLDFDEISEQGSIGDPFASTAATGEVLFNRMVECCVAFVNKMQQTDMHAVKQEV